MNKTRALIYFQRRIAAPSFFISAVMGITGGLEFWIEGTALAYLFVSLLLHYFIYEVMNKNTYMFYANLGFSRWFLWCSTMIIAFLLIVLSNLL